MIMQDKLEKERNDAKNNVEEYVYDMRDKLHGILEKFVNEAVSMALPRVLRRCDLGRHTLISVVHHAGPGRVLSKAGGHGDLAVWRRRGPTETSLHW